MKKSRDNLESLLSEGIKEIKSSRKSVFQINKILSENKVKLGTFEEISKGDRLLNSLDIPLLWAITSALYQESNNSSLNPDDWFTTSDIKLAKNTLENDSDTTNKMMLPIAIPNVVSLDHENFITEVDMKFLVDMMNSQLILYEFDSQRSAKYDRFGSPIPDVNKKSVDDICMHMLNDTYLPDMMTLNAYSDEIEAVDYDSKSKILTLNQGAIITILDGFHRLQGGAKAVKINPELSQKMILSIRNYDADKARKYFGQVNTVNVVKKERLKELKSEKFSDMSVRDLQQNIELKGKIASASRITEVAGHLTTFDTLSYFIDQVYRPTSRMEAREAAKELSVFYEYLIGFYPDEFSLNPNKYRDTNINHPLVFAGYVVMAKFLSDNNIPLKNIKNIIEEKFDFSDTQLVEILNSNRGVNNKKIRDKIISYFMAKLSEEE